jgi:hypothetical protein
MAKPSKHRTETAVELEPDAWQRFERAVDVVAKSPPQHRTSKDAPKKRLPKSRREKHEPPK